MLSTTNPDYCGLDSGTKQISGQRMIQALRIDIAKSIAPKIH